MKTFDADAIRAALQARYEDAVKSVASGLTAAIIQAFSNYLQQLVEDQILNTYTISVVGGNPPDFLPQIQISCRGGDSRLLMAFPPRSA